MYAIYADGLCIYNDQYVTDNTVVLEPVLTIEDNLAGSLKMILPPNNIGYSSIKKLITELVVKKHGKEIWAGRILDDHYDFYNNRDVVCEGELAYFNDSIQPPFKYSNMSVQAYLARLIEVHNSKVEPKKKFTIGAVTVHDEPGATIPDRITNRDNTMKYLKEHLLGVYGGHLRIRKENGIRYLDYLQKYVSTNSQIIRFGVNLIDISQKWDMPDYANAIIPLGDRLELLDKNQEDDGIERRLTIESVNGGSEYITMPDAISKYGRIEKVVQFDDVRDPNILKQKGLEYLTDLQYENMTLELTALDLHYLDVQYEDIKILDQIEVISKPHNLDRKITLTKLEIPLDMPENTQFTFGRSYKYSLTDKTVENTVKFGNEIAVSMSSVIQKTDKIAAENKEFITNTVPTILDQAKNNAKELMNLATNGYITIVQNEQGAQELYITDTPVWNNSSRRWRWNINGLSYTNNGGQSYSTAITMDGSIMADFIKAGTINGIYIKGSRIEGAKFVGGTIKIGDNRNYSEIDDTGVNYFCYVNGYPKRTMSLKPHIYNISGHQLYGYLGFYHSRNQFGSPEALIGYSENTDAFVINAIECGGYFAFGNTVYAEAKGQGFQMVGNLLVSGNMSCYGEKPAVVATEHYGCRKLYAYECDKLYFATQGEGEIRDGQCVIQLDPMFMETIENDSYHIQLTPKNKFMELYVTDIKPGSFIVRADYQLDGSFFYTLSAIRKGYKDTYLGRDENMEKLLDKEVNR